MSLSWPHLIWIKELMKRHFVIPIILILTFVLSGCQQAAPAYPESVTIVPESGLQPIALAGPASEARAEISGMAWCGDQVILLPQYPGLFRVNDEPAVFAVESADIAAYLSGEDTTPITPLQIPFYYNGLDTAIVGFEGFEAIAFIGQSFYVTLESSPAGGMKGYIARGVVVGDCERLELDPDSVIQIDPQAPLSNMSDETIVVFDGEVYTIYEANGVNVNPSPAAHVFNLELTITTTVPLDPLEYRITDASEPDEKGLFWAINYFYPGDTKLDPGMDRIVLDFGLGESHNGSDQVERLVAYQITEEGIVLAGEPPIYLALAGGEARNWEGLVKYQEGFLLVTDKFPSTILAFVVH
jgi:hypothetical protein